MTFGEKVRKAREEAGISQKRLAEMTGIAQRTIQNYETAGRLPKQREYYDLLADALNMDVSVLLDEDAEFVLKVTETYGSRASAQAEEVLERAQALFAGGEMEDEDMDAFMRRLQDAYWKAKEKNRKFVARKYRKQDEV